eukprot:1416453-Pyramimonas_sp.AAC.1
MACTSRPAHRSRSTVCERPPPLEAAWLCRRRRPHPRAPRPTAQAAVQGAEPAELPQLASAGRPAPLGGLARTRPPP